VLKEFDFEYLRNVYEVFWWFHIIKVFNFAKRIMPKFNYRIKSRKKILKTLVEFEYLIKLVQIIFAVVLLDRG
jgi:hypothetical protein